MNRNSRQIIARAAALAAVGLALGVATLDAQAQQARQGFGKRLDVKQINRARINRNRIRNRVNRGNGSAVQFGIRPGSNRENGGNIGGGRPQAKFAPRPGSVRENNGNLANNGNLRRQNRPGSGRVDQGNGFGGGRVVDNRPEPPRNRQIVIEANNNAVKPFGGNQIGNTPAPKIAETPKVEIEDKVAEKPKVEIEPKLEEKPKVELKEKAEETPKEKVKKLVPPTIFTAKQLEIWNKMSHEDKLKTLTRLVATYGHDYLYPTHKVERYDSDEYNTHDSYSHGDSYGHGTYGSYGHDGYNSYGHGGYSDGYHSGGGYSGGYSGGYTLNSYSGGGYNSHGGYGYGAQCK